MVLRYLDHNPSADSISRLKETLGTVVSSRGRHTFQYIIVRSGYFDNCGCHTSKHLSDNCAWYQSQS